VGGWGLIKMFFFIYRRLSVKKIYICGKITGLPLEDTKARFKASAEALEICGYTSVNPFEVLPPHPDHAWNDHMRADIKALVDCDYIYIMDNAQDSRGAMLEMRIASALGIPRWEEC